MPRWLFFKPLHNTIFASVGLGVSGSQDLGEIAGLYAICAQGDQHSARAINGCISHQLMAPQSISSPSKPTHFFPPSHALQLARQSSQPPGLCRLGVGSISQRWGTSYGPYGLAGPPIRLASPALGQPNHHLTVYIVPDRVSVLTDENTKKTFARLAICILAALVAASPFKCPTVMMMVVIKWYPTF